MRKRHFNLRNLTAASWLLAGAAVFPAHAASIILNFEGITNNAPVGNFYDGGAGTDHGITFSSSGFGLIDADAGGSGNFANEPSPSTVLSFTALGSMNVMSGFTGAFTFYYSSNTTNAVITVYDSLDATGTVLGSLALAQQATANNCGGDPTGLSCNWTQAGIAFAGTAKSVSFGGIANNVAFDNFALNLVDTIPTAPTAAPEPNSLALLGLGLAAFLFVRKGDVSI